MKDLKQLSGIFLGGSCDLFQAHVMKSYVWEILIGQCLVEVADVCKSAYHSTWREICKTVL